MRSPVFDLSAVIGFYRFRLLLIAFNHLRVQIVVNTLIELHLGFCRREIAHIHIVNLFQFGNKVCFVKVYIGSFFITKQQYREEEFRGIAEGSDEQDAVRSEDFSPQLSTFQ